MRALADLLRPPRLEALPDDLPALMRGQVVDPETPTATIPAIDGGKYAHRLHGTLPDTPAEGDTVWVALDDAHELVAFAWEAA